MGVLHSSEQRSKKSLYEDYYREHGSKITKILDNIKQLKIHYSKLKSLRAAQALQNSTPADSEKHQDCEKALAILDNNEVILSRFLDFLVNPAMSPPKLPNEILSSTQYQLFSEKAKSDTYPLASQLLYDCLLIKEDRHPANQDTINYWAYHENLDCDFLDCFISDVKRHISNASICITELHTDIDPLSNKRTAAKNQLNKLVQHLRNLHNINNKINGTPANDIKTALTSYLPALNTIDDSHSIANAVTDRLTPLIDNAQNSKDLEQLSKKINSAASLMSFETARQTRRIIYSLLKNITAKKTILDRFFGSEYTESITSERNQANTVIDTLKYALQNINQDSQATLSVGAVVSTAFNFIIDSYFTIEKIIAKTYSDTDTSSLSIDDLDLSALKSSCFSEAEFENFLNFKIDALNEANKQIDAIHQNALTKIAHAQKAQATKQNSDNDRASFKKASPSSSEINGTVATSDPFTLALKKAEKKAEKKKLSAASTVNSASALEKGNKSGTGLEKANNSVIAENSSSTSKVLTTTETLPPKKPLQTLRDAPRSDVLGDPRFNRDNRKQQDNDLHNQAVLADNERERSTTIDTKKNSLVVPPTPPVIIPPRKRPGKAITKQVPADTKKSSLIGPPASPIIIPPGKLPGTPITKQASADTKKNSLIGPPAPPIIIPPRKHPGAPITKQVSADVKTELLPPLSQEESLSRESDNRLNPKLPDANSLVQNTDNNLLVQLPHVDSLPQNPNNDALPPLPDVNSLQQNTDNNALPQLPDVNSLSAEPTTLPLFPKETKQSTNVTAKIANPAALKMATTASPQNIIAPPQKANVSLVNIALKQHVIAVRRYQSTLTNLSRDIQKNLEIFKAAKTINLDAEQDLRTIKAKIDKRVREINTSKITDYQNGHAISYARNIILNDKSQYGDSLNIGNTINQAVAENEAILPKNKSSWFGRLTNTLQSISSLIFNLLSLQFYSIHQMEKKQDSFNSDANLKNPKVFIKSLQTQFETAGSEAIEYIEKYEKNMQLENDRRYEFVRANAVANQTVRSSANNRHGFHAKKVSEIAPQILPSQQCQSNTASVESSAEKELRTSLMRW